MRSQYFYHVTKVDQSQVTFHQHGGHYTRANTQPNPDVWVGKVAHGSYDIGCDGHGWV